VITGAASTVRARSRIAAREGTNVVRADVLADALDKSTAKIDAALRATD
jgi:hypothetical protein